MKLASSNIPASREPEGVRHGGRAGWNHIETAPRDGKRILLASKPSISVGPDGPVPIGPNVHIGYWNPNGDSWVDEYGSFDGDADHLESTGVFNVGSGWLQPDEVTHWMPLPDAPGTISEGGGGV